MRISSLVFFCAYVNGGVYAFQRTRAPVTRLQQNMIPLHGSLTADNNVKAETEEQKKKLLGIIGKKGYLETVLADPDTKEPLQVVTSGVWIGGEPGSQKTKFELTTGNKTYAGTSDTFLNLLEAVKIADDENNNKPKQNALARETAKRLLPLIPPPLRSPLAMAGFPVGDDYVPMRDLFTSPTVSFAYERGWRQGFRRAGFPGPDKEAELAMEYFTPAVANSEESSVLVDMSCATGEFLEDVQKVLPGQTSIKAPFAQTFLSEFVEGLFTRRFAKSGKYDRVLGCDYSESMLLEARRRIMADPSLSGNKRKCRLDLVKLDVGRIPMRENSVDALHAGMSSRCNNQNN